MIVDDEALIRSGFELILSEVDDIEVVATCDGVGAVQLIAEHHPDVVLLDIRMPGKDGLAVLAELQKSASSPIVAMLTTFGADEYVASALRLGAAGFLLKDTDPEQLPYMVRSLAAGGLVLSEKISPKVIAGYLDDGFDQAAIGSVGALTNRETEVLRSLQRRDRGDSVLKCRDGQRSGQFDSGQALRQVARRSRDHRPTRRHTRR